MVKLYDISNWNEQSWWNTGGTRDKKIYLNPDDGELYYFKQSFKKGQRDYQHEFWSEIIASEIGNVLDFDILPYHIAIRGKIIGCISKSMINDSEELIEGGKYLQAFDNTFTPEDVKSRHKYNFELIINALTAFNKEKHFPNLIETIVFDALIGNSDRHQENWAIINTLTAVSEAVEQIQTNKIDELPNWLQKLTKAVDMVKGKIRPEIQKVRLMLPTETRFAPIYDSGCSFGRELTDERVLGMLQDEEEIQKYINKGKAEIHWENEKINHFELIEKLLKKEELKEMVLSSLKKISNGFNTDDIKNIIDNIDKELLNTGRTNILPTERKEMILKLLTLRFYRINELYSQNK